MINSNGFAMQGTANLVEVARRAGVKRFVLVSSIGADEPFFPLNLLFGVGFSGCVTPVPLASDRLSPPPSPSMGTQAVDVCTGAELRFEQCRR